MVNLDFFHKLNYTSEKLIDELYKRFNDNFLNRVFDIEGTLYRHIKIINAESKIKKILNSQQSIINCYNTETVSAILNLNNIIYGNKNSEIITKSYDILMFDMSIISIRQRIIGDTKNPDKYINESECPKAIELGKKAIYLLGLDYAMVTVALTGRRKFKILHINPSPVIRNKDLSLLVSKLESLYLNNFSGETVPVKLGADPEFMLFNSKSGKIVAASEFFPREGIVGCDNIRIPNRQQRPVAEIRPKPELSPHNLLDNIKDALKAANKLAPYRNIKWIAGSHPTGNYSIGGHIHFSNIELNYSLLRALDNYVGIPVFLIENSVSAAQRRKRYGLLADFRKKDYGGFEYRTLGSWLVSPQIALAVLCLAKIVATHHMELTENFLDNYDAQAAFYQGNQDFFRSIFNRLWSDITSVENYSNYSNELKIIFHMITNKIIWDEKSDFREVWKITENTKRHYYNGNHRTIEKNNVTPRRSGQDSRSRNITDLQAVQIPSSSWQNVDSPINNMSSSQSTAGHVTRGNIISHEEVISNYTRSTRILH